MEAVSTRHRLQGLEPDNLLAFLALIGLLRTLEAHDATVAEEERLRPRAAWDLDALPLRPLVVVARPVGRSQIGQCAAAGLDRLAADYGFDGRRDLNYSKNDASRLLDDAADAASASGRGRVDLLAALMTDAAIKDSKDEVIDPTPFCLLFGQGHQHFLERVASVPAQQTPPPRGKGRSAIAISAVEALCETLFEPWHRTDATDSFRWDPEEDVRYALMAGDPSAAAYKGGTQHGANRLAIAGLPVFTVVPEQRAGRVRPSVIGGAFGPVGFSVAWPIWRDPASLASIRGLLAHPDLRTPDRLRHLSVDHVVVARRISVGKFMNFSRARRIVDAR